MAVPELIDNTINSMKMLKQVKWNLQNKLFSENTVFKGSAVCWLFISGIICVEVKKCGDAELLLDHRHLNEKTCLCS